jgi:hypothetical protein
MNILFPRTFDAVKKCEALESQFERACHPQTAEEIAEALRLLEEITQAWGSAADVFRGEGPVSNPVTVDPRSKLDRERLREIAKSKTPGRRFVRPTD